MAPTIAIAHDYLTQRGGAERLVLSIAQAFPDAPIHTLFYCPEQTYPEFADKEIHTSGFNRIGPFRRNPRLALPFLAGAASRQHIDADIVIASSSGWAHAFPTTGAKLVYCHSPARWLYVRHDYFAGTSRFSPVRVAAAALTPALRRWDQRAARHADAYLANSSVIRQRIRSVYGIDAQTLFPPFRSSTVDGTQEEIPELAGWGGTGESPQGHYLVVSRLQPYKHVDAVIEAFRDLPDRRLLIIGSGPLRERLQAMAPGNVRLAEGLSDAQMRWAYGHAAALIAASHEDFGLTPLEAGAHGVPTLALRAGGYLDTIAENVNGLFFAAPTPESIRAGVHQLEEHTPWRASVVRRRTQKFSEEAFIDSLRERVAELMVST